MPEVPLVPGPCNLGRRVTTVCVGPYDHMASGHRGHSTGWFVQGFHSEAISVLAQRTPLGVEGHVHTITDTSFEALGA